MYEIEKIQTEYSELSNLIANSNMDEEEKQYWFDLIPFMNDTQKNKFGAILDLELFLNRKR